MNHQIRSARFVQRQTRILVRHDSAEAGRDAGEQLAQLQLRNHGVSDVEQRLQTVALTGELELVFVGRFRVQGIVDGHRDLRRHAPHELQLDVVDAMRREITEAQRPELAMRGGEGDERAGNDAIRAQDLRHRRPVRIVGDVFQNKRALIEVDPTGWRFGDGQLDARHVRGNVGFEHVQMHAVRFRIVENQGDEIEWQNGAELGRETAE